MPELSTPVIIALVVLGLPAYVYLFWLVHCACDRCCVRHARRFCKENGLEISRLRWQPAFYESGVKSEFTLVSLDCFDAQKQRKLVLLLAWPFGVRKVVSNEHIRSPMIDSGLRQAVNILANWRAGRISRLPKNGG